MNCRECGRPIPDDEQQIVRDQVAVAIKPMAEAYGWSEERLLGDLENKGPIDIAFCAVCFNKLNAENPLSELVAMLAAHPTMNPTLFTMTRIVEGANHV